MYRRHWIVRLAHSSRFSYFINNTIPSVAAALVFAMVFFVAPLLHLGITDSSGPAASDPVPVCISSLDTTRHEQIDEPGPGTIASRVGLDCVGEGR
jgi:hypothetical protein